MTASISNAKSVTASVSGPGHPQAAQQKTRQPAAGKIAESRCSERNLRVSADRSHVEMTRLLLVFGNARHVSKLPTFRP